MSQLSDMVSYKAILKYQSIVGEVKGKNHGLTTLKIMIFIIIKIKCLV